MMLYIFEKSAANVVWGMHTRLIPLNGPDEAAQNAHNDKKEARYQKFIHVWDMVNLQATSTKQKK